MELDRALELAVVSSWNELVPPGDLSSVHVEYQNLSRLPVSSVEVWMIKKRGYGTLVCRCSASRSQPTPYPSESLPCIFENNYRSTTLAGDLDFIMRNQDQFSRPAEHSIHGFVQIGAPSDEDRASANAWSQSARPDSARSAAV